MCFIKRMCLIQVFASKKSRICSMDQLLANQPPNPIVSVIPGKRCQHQQRHENVQLHGTHATQCARHKQQRIAGQKWRNYQPGFGENNNEQDDVNPVAVLLNQRQQVCVRMQDNIK